MLHTTVSVIVESSAAVLVEVYSPAVFLRWRKFPAHPCQLAPPSVAASKCEIPAILCVIPNKLTVGNTAFSRIIGQHSLSIMFAEKQDAN